MEEENVWKHIRYVFNVQSPEDFYRQLNEHADEILSSYETGEDLSLAKQALEKIGVKC